MKNILSIVLVGMSLMLASCGGDKQESGKSSSLVFGLGALNSRTIEGFFNPAVQAPIIVGGVSYLISPETNPQVISQALNIAGMNKIQPVSNNGVLMFRARITGFLFNNSFPGQTQQSNMLTVTQLQFY